MVIDTHAHLSNENYYDLDRIISDMPKDNLNSIICASASFEESKSSLILANKNNNIFCMLGLHPDNCYEYLKEYEEFLINNLSNKKVVAVGEIGLDYHSEGYDKE